MSDSATPWTAARQASLSITSSRNMLKLMSIESVMPSNHFILCHPLLLPPSIFPSIRVFSNESVLHIRWPKYWSFSFSISPSSEYSGLISFRMDWLVDPSIDFFVFGHQHKPMQYKTGDHALTTVVGNWIYDFTYAVFDGDTVTLKKFDN